MITAILKLVLPIAKTAAGKMDGKKTWTGVLLTATGIGMLFVPALQKDGIYAIVTGGPILITGIWHKLKKRKQAMSQQTIEREVTIMGEGMKETFELSDFITGLATAVDKSLSDGFQFTDPIAWTPELMKLPGAINGIEKVPTEVEDMDLDEAREWGERISRLDFRSEYTEAIAEQSLIAGKEFVKLVLLIRKARIPQAA